MWNATKSSFSLALLGNYINCNLHVGVCPDLREGSQAFIQTRKDMMSRNPGNPAVLGHSSEEVSSAGRHKWSIQSLCHRITEMVRDSKRKVACQHWVVHRLMKNGWGYSLSDHHNQFFSGTVSGPHPPRTGLANAFVPTRAQTCQDSPWIVALI